MALINCPECKKEISDIADKCPNCGYPVRNHTAQQEYDHEKSSDSEEFSETGYTGRRGLKCLSCGSRNISIENDIPTHKKVLEIAAFGAVSPMTKKQYKPGMKYTCQNCNAKWNEENTKSKSETFSKTSVSRKKNVGIPVTLGLISTCFACILIAAIMTSVRGLQSYFLLFLYASVCLLGGVLSFVSLMVPSINKSIRVIFILTLLISGILTTNNLDDFFIVVVSLVFIGLSELNISKSTKAH